MESQDTLLFAKHGKLIEDEKYLKETLAEYRKNAANVMGSREALIQHRITCDVLSTKLDKVLHDLEFTERLIAALFQTGKLDAQNKDSGQS
jgi:hypothetical protein